MSFTTIGELKAAEFLLELTELSRRHRLALTGSPVMFEMEPEDMGGKYWANSESVLEFK